LDSLQALDIMRSALMIGVKLCAPTLLMSMAVGIMISIIQAATQIHEQTITFVPKLIVIAVVLLIGGSWMLTVLQDFTKELFVIMQG
jgi:flagellar biosynthetic protein FliQ